MNGQGQPQPHPTGLDMSGLVLMGMPMCMGCAQASRWLEDEGLAYKKYDVSTNQQIQNWIIQTTGQRSVPQFFLNGHYVQGGFAQVQQLARMGQLPKPGVTQLR